MITQDKIKYDYRTKKWFHENPGVQSTVVRCDKCGLFFKPILGHNCKKEKADER